MSWSTKSPATVKLPKLIAPCYQKRSNMLQSSLLQVWTICVAGYANDAIVGACHRTSDGQEHKIIWRAGLERNTIFPLTCHSMQRARQPLSRLAWVASRWQGTSCSSSFVSKVLGANWKRANNFHPVPDKFAMCTDR